MIDRPLLAKRLNEAYENLRSAGVIHTKIEFAKALGKTHSDISKALAAQGRVMTQGLLERVADTFPEYLNKNYLLTGEGEVARPSRSMRPHIQAKAAAGFMDVISEGDYGDDMKPIIPFFRNYDFTIEVEGESMLPNYREGDILACRITTDRLNPPIDKVCVIDSQSGAFVKEITGMTGTAIVCHSFNPLYNDFKIDFNNINRVAVVVGSLRLEE